MDDQSAATSARVELSRRGLDDLIAVLQHDGYRVVGPTVRDDAVVLAELGSGSDLPAGWSVDSAPGRYRLRRRADAAVFAHSAGAQSWKQFLHPAHRTLWTTDDRGFTPASAPAVRYAFLGVRACDLAAITTLRTVLRGGSADRIDPLIITVGCTEPGGVCFCASMGTGPDPGPGYDLSLVELIDERGHRFVVDIGTQRGGDVLAALPSLQSAAPADVQSAHDAVAAAALQMQRAMPEVDLRQLLVDSRESPRWDDIAERCLQCGNCTMVCPTCFCTTTEDHTDLATGAAEHSQRWASCFEIDFSYLHGGAVRQSGASRYRQWLTHKLSSWHDQFGSSGCVGCGRCIAWCPVGIDITAEAAALAADARSAGGVDS